MAKDNGAIWQNG